MEISDNDLRRLSRLLDEALELEPEERAGWIASLDPEYEDLRARLDELLLPARPVETLDFMPRLPQFSRLPATIVASAGDMVGPYKLLRELGSGATSHVWLAERADGTLQRKVAVKMPRLGFIDHTFLARMELERDILAGLEHPNIARLYDAGADAKGRPYLALEYVNGVPPDVYCRDHASSLRERLELFLLIARAVAFAHARLIVHRDLKPNNILVTAEGDVRLLDFGIARLLQTDQVASENQTQSGAHALTPAYAAPEQFTNQQITVATDVYSLGVILFELLTGRSPYVTPRRTLREFEDAVLKGDPPLASQFAPQAELRALRGDLDTILAKALKRIPAERYDSVEALALDIERHLLGLPIAARPPSFWYVAKKFARRNSVALCVAAIFVAVISEISAVAAWQWRQALAQRTVAQERLADAEAAVDFSSAVLSEQIQRGERISIDELMARSESVALEAGGDDIRKKVIAASLVASWYMALGLEPKADALLARTMALVPSENQDLLARLACLRISMSNDPVDTRDVPATQAQCLLRGSTVEISMLGDSTARLNYSQEALRQYRLSGGQSLYEEARLLAQIGSSYSLGGETDLALATYDQSISLLIKAGRANSFVMQYVRSSAGVAWQNAGNPLRALEQMDATAAIEQRHFGRAGAPGHVRVGNRAVILTELARYAEADQQFALAQLLVKDAQASTGDKIYVLAGQAAVAVETGRLNRANSLLSEAAELLRKDPGQPRIAATAAYEMAQAMLFAAKGRSADADSMFIKVNKLFDDAGCCIGKQVRVLAMRADLMTRSGHLDQAQALATRARELARQVQGKLLHSCFTGMSLAALARVREAQGRNREARDYYALAATHFANTLGEKHRDTTRARDDAARVEKM